MSNGNDTPETKSNFFTEAVKIRDLGYTKEELPFALYRSGDRHFVRVKLPESFIVGGQKFTPRYDSAVYFPGLSDLPDVKGIEVD